MLGLDCVNAKYRNELIKTYNLDSPEETDLAIEVYDYLLRLGYCPKHKGVIFFNEMIVSIISQISAIQELQGEEMEKLLCQIYSPYSQFYLDLSRNKYDIGVTTYHEYIREALQLEETEMAGPKAFAIAVQLLRSKGLEINIEPLVLKLTK